jgi:hemoglobin
VTPTTIFESIGGRPTVDALVHSFYAVMDEAPEATAVRATHGSDLKESASKLADFLTGWSGGPPAYVEKYGHPRLRARHMPFKIGRQERDEWLWCMEHALNDPAVRALGMDDDHAFKLLSAFERIATHMQNQPG